MAKALESPEPRLSETENIIQEYRERLEQALKTEKAKLKERAEQDCAQIVARASEESNAIVVAAREGAEQILKEARARADEEASGKFAQAQQKAEQLIRDADRLAEEKAKEKTKGEVQKLLTKAREEADRTVAQAKKEAKTEADRILASTKEEAEQAAREARARAYADAQQESSKIINDTRERVAQIVTEIMSSGKAQVKSHFARLAAETKVKLEGEVSKLLAQATRNIEEITVESEKSVQAELKYLATVVAEVEKSLQPAGDVPGKENLGRPSPVTCETASQETPTSEKAEATSLLKDNKKNMPAEDTDSRIYRGNLNLEVSPPYSRVQLNSVLEYLSRVPGLKVLSAGGYLEEDRCVMTYYISLGQPTPLLKILRAMPQVGEVIPHGENVAIAMKAADSVAGPPAKK